MTSTAPLGVLCIIVVAVFLFPMYVLVGLSSTTFPLALRLGGIAVGVAHVVAAFGLGRMRRWGWTAGMVVLSLDLALFIWIPNQGSYYLEGVVMLGVLVAYLWFQRDVYYRETSR